MELLEELKTKRNITRQDISNLLESIGVPGDKREEKVEAVASLQLANFQQVDLSTQLTDYQAY